MILTIYCFILSLIISITVYTVSGFYSDVSLVDFIMNVIEGCTFLLIAHILVLVGFMYIVILLNN